MAGRPISSSASCASCLLCAKRERADEYGWRHFGDLYADHETLGYDGDDIFVIDNVSDTVSTEKASYIQREENNRKSFRKENENNILNDKEKTDLDNPPSLSECTEAIFNMKKNK